MIKKLRDNLRQTLRSKGFRRDRSITDAQKYDGSIKTANRTIQVSVTIHDLDFTTLPSIHVIDADDKLSTNPAHVDANGSLCYALADDFVRDRCDPGGTVLQCLAQAKKALERILSTNLSHEIEAEFPSYWREEFVWADTSVSYHGEAKIYVFKSPLGETFNLLSNSSNLADHFVVLGFKLKGVHDAIIVNSASRLGVNGPFPPQNLQETFDWLKAIDADVEKKARKYFSQHKNVGGFFFVSAPNAICGFDITLTSQLKAAFKKGHRPETLGNLVIQNAEKIDITRCSAERLDEDILVGRNLNGRADLRGKRIALIGCGTIGSHLSKFLVQAGAGYGGGILHLYDRDVLQGANIGRHLLGIEHVQRNKADACTIELHRLYPGAFIQSHPRSVIDDFTMVKSADLVIDATGDETLSNAINSRAVESWKKGISFPPVIYVWLFGNGVAAQALFSSDLKSACYRCLHPRLDKNWHHSPMKSGKIEDARVHGTCGDNPYIPYPVSASAVAAALGLEMVLDWVGGDTSRHLRTRRIDYSVTRHIDDKTPEPHQSCKVCHGVE